jgi:hypothetical protein
MRRVLASVLLLALAGCAGGGSAPTPVVPTPTPVPNAAITATGAGTLVLHPSAVRAFAVALETPIRITESAGGSADWGFARMSIYNRGREVERTELTANDIQRGGAGRIEGHSNRVQRVIFRFNSTSFDRIDLTLGFSDVKDARPFTATVPFDSFTDVDISVTPASVAHSRTPL